MNSSRFDKDLEQVRMGLMSNVVYGDDVMKDKTNTLQFGANGGLLNFHNLMFAGGFKKPNQKYSKKVLLKKTAPKFREWSAFYHHHPKLLRLRSATHGYVDMMTLIKCQGKSNLLNILHKNHLLDKSQYFNGIHANRNDLDNAMTQSMLYQDEVKGSTDPDMMSTEAEANWKIGSRLGWLKSSRLISPKREREMDKGLNKAVEDNMNHGNHNPMHSLKYISHSWSEPVHLDNPKSNGPKRKQNKIRTSSDYFKLIYGPQHNNIPPKRMTPKQKSNFNKSWNAYAAKHGLVSAGAALSAAGFNGKHMFNAATGSFRFLGHMFKDGLRNMHDQHVQKSEAKLKSESRVVRNHDKMPNNHQSKKHKFSNKPHHKQAFGPRMIARHTRSPERKMAKDLKGSDNLFFKTLGLAFAMMADDDKKVINSKFLNSVSPEAIKKHLKHAEIRYKYHQIQKSKSDKTKDDDKPRNKYYVPKHKKRVTPDYDGPDL